MKLSRIISLTILGAILLGTAACSSNDELDKGTTKPEYKAIELSRAEQSFVATQNTFAKKLYLGMHNSGNADNKDNLILSPLSASVTLSMVASGANGDTRDQITSALGFAGEDIEAVNSFNSRLNRTLVDVDPTTVFNLANAAWFDRSISVKDSYIKLCRESYGMTADCVDMYTETTRQSINKWASDNTKGLIDNFIESVEDLKDYKLMLANALYFKGLWADKFDKNETNKSTFLNADGTKSTVEMMHNNFKGNAVVSRNYTAVDMSFGSGNYNIVFVLPVEEYDFASILPELDDKNFPSLYTDSYDIDLSLPRFDITCNKMSLMDVLFSMGVQDLFIDGVCDMSAACDDALFVQDILQTTRLKVDEEGAEAAAVTMTGWYGTSGTSGSIVLSFDRPFGFYIYEHSTKAILFIGDVNKL